MATNTPSIAEISKIASVIQKNTADFIDDIKRVQLYIQAVCGSPDSVIDLHGVGGVVALAEARLVDAQNLYGDGIADLYNLVTHYGLQFGIRPGLPAWYGFAVPGCNYSGGPNYDAAAPDPTGGAGHNCDFISLFNKAAQPMDNEWLAAGDTIYVSGSSRLPGPSATIIGDTDRLYTVEGIGTGSFAQRIYLGLADPLPSGRSNGADVFGAFYTDPDSDYDYSLSLVRVIKV